jgi:multicomponent K+:H+ antiporter subunit A
LLLVFRRMPRLGADRRPAATRIAHLGIALATGACVTLLAWSAGSSGAATRAGQAQLGLSLPLGHGHNVVNVILVDFRGADTLGEIVVLAIAALGVVALAVRPARPRQGSRIMSFLLARGAQLLFPTTLVCAAYQMLRGHDQPGGGFSAGLVTSLAIVIQAFVFGLPSTRARLQRLLRPAAWVGLVIALGAGLFPMLRGDPFLTHYHLDLLDSGLGLSTTLLFDLGVFGAVVGTTTLVLDVLSEEPAS